MVAASSDGRRSKRANPLDNAQADPTGQRVPLFILPLSFSFSLIWRDTGCSFSQRYTYRYPLVFDSSVTSYFTLIAGLSPVAFSCLISWYLTQRSCKLLQRTERVVVLLNAGISALLYRHLPLALWALLYTLIYIYYRIINNSLLRIVYFAHPKYYCRLITSLASRIILVCYQSYRFSE